MNFNSVTRRSELFRLITIFTSGFGAASLAFWALMLTRIGSPETFGLSLSGGAIAALAAFAGAGCAHVYFLNLQRPSRAHEPSTLTDPMTELLSKDGLEKEMLRLFTPKKSIGRGTGRWMLASVEIDAFRDINDAHGLETGDTVLRVVAGRLARLVGKYGPVARIGGSEFAFAIELSRDDHELSAVMSSVIDEVAKPVNADRKTITVFCTAGLVELTRGNLSVAKTLRRTKLARATARSSGLGNWAIYHPEMTRSASYRKWIESELPRALANDEFDLVYQPQVNNLSGKTVGYEALLRWTHPQKGVFPPSEFICVAEMRGLIGQIGKWVIRRACEDSRLLEPGVTIAVNVSPKQLESPFFVSDLAKILEQTHTDPGRIEIEITENILICNHDEVREQFEQIRHLGCSIAIDDFGTGYSNLGYLAELPFSKLKLDRSLVARLGEKENAGALVSTIVNLAHALDVAILAEGVETEDQVILLRAAGCTLMQGYYFGKPLQLMHSDRTVVPLAIKA
jgi:diguanylate cyclase (GGDEF)-like protein